MYLKFTCDEISYVFRGAISWPWERGEDFFRTRNSCGQVSFVFANFVVSFHPLSLLPVRFFPGAECPMYISGHCLRTSDYGYSLNRSCWLFQNRPDIAHDLFLSLKTCQKHLFHNLHIITEANKPQVHKQQNVFLGGLAQGSRCKNI